MAVTLGADTLARYRRFSLYNSPFVAHEEGCAIDLYPPADATTVPSPVAGEVVDTRAVQAPPKPYAAEQDHLILVDTGDRVARTLHVEPAVEAGERLAVGDPLGTPVRAGFFAPWVPNHVHLGFRAPGANHYRASGSLPIELGADVDLRRVEWDGSGTVVERGETYARLDRPAHPAPGEAFAGIAAGGGVLDGGFPHYDGGGLLGGRESGPVALAGATVGDVDGRNVAWRDREVRVDGTPITGIALFCAWEDIGAKLVGEGVDVDVGDEVRVTIR
jgi:hypothetical protein